MFFLPKIIILILVNDHMLMNKKRHHMCLRHRLINKTTTSALSRVAPLVIYARVDLLSVTPQNSKIFNDFFKANENYLLNKILVRANYTDQMGNKSANKRNSL